MNGKLYFTIITIIINQQKKQLSLCPLFVFPAQRQQSGAQGQEKPPVTNGRAQRRSECKSLIIFVSRWTLLLSYLVTAWQILLLLLVYSRYKLVKMCLNITYLQIFC